MMNEMPEMHPVASTNIDAIGFSSSGQCIYVRFVSGRTYVYFDASEDLFAAFLSAPSKGQFFNACIRGLRGHEM